MSQLLVSVVTERQSVVWTVRSSNPLLTLAPEYPTLYCGENPYPKRLKTQLTGFECGKVLHGRVSSEECFLANRQESEGPPRLGVYNIWFRSQATTARPSEDVLYGQDLKATPSDHTPR